MGRIPKKGQLESQQLHPFFYLMGLSDQAEGIGKKKWFRNVGPPCHLHLGSPVSCNGTLVGLFS